MRLPCILGFSTRDVNRRTFCLLRCFSFRPKRCRERTEPVRSKRRRFRSLLPSPSSPPVSARPCRAQLCASSSPPGCSGIAAGDGGYCCDLLWTTRSSLAAATRRSYRRPSPKMITATTRRSSSSSSSSKGASLKSSYAKRLLATFDALVSSSGILGGVEVAQMGRTGSGRRRLERDSRTRSLLLPRDRRRTSKKRSRITASEIGRLG